MIKAKIVNQRFGRLLVVKDVDPHTQPSGQIKHQVLCRCDCGVEKVIRNHSLKNGSTQSCGCLQKERAKAASIKHGKSRTKLYKVWCGMKERCANPAKKGYERYGGRGIEVCQEWRSSYPNFELWCIGNGYQQGLHIDRKENNGNYEPNNCRFVTPLVNARNRPQAKIWEIDGVPYRSKDCAAEAHGVSAVTVKRRVKNPNWPTWINYASQ